MVERAYIGGHRPCRSVCDGEELPGIDDLRRLGAAKLADRANLRVECKLERPGTAASVALALVHGDQSISTRFELMLPRRATLATFARTKLDIEVTLGTRSCDQIGRAHV